MGFNKFNARRVGGFDSDFEKKVYRDLEIMELKGHISGLRKQVRFCIIPQVIGHHKVQLKTKSKVERFVAESAHYYTADCAYYDHQLQKYVLCEIKGEYTYKLQDYHLRRALMLNKIAEHNKKGKEEWCFVEIVNFTSKGKRGVKRFINGHKAEDYSYILV